MTPPGPFGVSDGEQVRVEYRVTPPREGTSAKGRYLSV